MASTQEDRLARELHEHQERLGKARERIRKLKERQAAVRERNRGHMQTVFGAAVFDAIETDRRLRSIIAAVLPKYVLTRRDRELFADLLPKNFVLPTGDEVPPDGAGSSPTGDDGTPEGAGSSPVETEEPAPFYPNAAA